MPISKVLSNITNMKAGKTSSTCFPRMLAIVDRLNMSKDNIVDRLNMSKDNIVYRLNMNKDYIVNRLNIHVIFTIIDIQYRKVRFREYSNQRHPFRLYKYQTV